MQNRHLKKAKERDMMDMLWWKTGPDVECMQIEKECGKERRVGV